MTKRTDEASVVVDYAYDTANRLTERKKSGSSTDIETFVYDGLGRMITAQKGSTGSSDAVSRSLFAYDSLSRVLSESQAISQGTAKVVTYTYQKSGNRVEVDYPISAVRTTYDYDQRDRGTKISHTDAVFEAPTTLADYTWIGSAINQRDTTCDYPGTTKPKFKTAFERDGILRVTKVDNEHLTSDQATSGYNDLGEFDYTYDGFRVAFICGTLSRSGLPLETGHTAVWRTFRARRQTAHISAVRHHPRADQTPPATHAETPPTLPPPSRRWASPDRPISRQNPMLSPSHSSIWPMVRRPMLPHTVTTHFDQ